MPPHPSIRCVTLRQALDALRMRGHNRINEPPLRLAGQPPVTPGFPLVSSASSPDLPGPITVSAASLRDNTPQKPSPCCSKRQSDRPSKLTRNLCPFTRYLITFYSLRFTFSPPPSARPQASGRGGSRR